MSDLLTELREHDLPPSCDGIAVEWLGWQILPTHVFICGRGRPEPDCCRACGSLTPSVINRGVRRVHLGGKDRVLAVLMAYRCPDCRHDAVHEHGDDQWWDLDHTDYGDEGSNNPSTSHERNPSWTS